MTTQNAGSGSASPCRQHPIAVLQYTYRYLFLLLVPLLRGVRYIRTPLGPYHWARGTWIDLLAVALLLLLPLIAWRYHTYTLTETAFVIHRGVLVRRASYIPRRHIATLSVEQPFYLRPLRAVRLFIDTDAGSGQRADFRLIVNARQAALILEQQPRDAHLPRYFFHPRLHRMILLSLLCSNSLSGILLLALTFQRVGYLLGQGFQNQLIGNLEEAADSVKVIPRTAALLAMLLIAGWCVAALGNLLRHTPFRAIRCPSTLTVRTGFITLREYSCTTISVNYADIRQTLSSRLFRLRTVFINCIGYGKAKNTLSVLIPFCRGETARQELHHLLPEYRPAPVTLRPAPYSLYRYCFFPLWGMLLLFPLSLVMQRAFPAWQELIYYVTFMAYLPCLWLLAVRLTDRYTAGAAYADGIYTLRYSRWFTLHTVLVPQDKLVTVRFRQTIFQRRRGTCTVLLYTYNESKQPHRIKNLRLADAIALFASTAADKKDV